MTTSNIERFDEIAGKVFGMLYQEFPVPTYLPAENFVEESTRYCEHVAGDVPSENADFFTACVQWLAEAGHLKYGSLIHDTAAFTDVVLTAKGLEVLKATPQSLQNGPSLGERLMDASKTGSKEVVRGAVGEVLSLGARIFSQHLGLPI